MAAPVPLQTLTTKQTRKKVLRHFNFGMVLTHVILLVIGFFYLYPFLWMLSGSLKSRAGFFEQGLSLIPDKWQWNNYVEAWTTGQFGQYFWNTVVITAFTMAFTILLTSMAGFAIARLRMVGKRVFLGIIFVTMLLPGGYTILPLFELIMGLGLNNTLAAVILINTAGALIFNTFLFVGYFSTLSREVEEAAIMDGASIPQLYWNICMPMAGPIIATIALFQFIANWNSFFIPLVFTLGNSELRPLAVGMYAFVGENSQDWTLTCAGAVITLLPIVVVFVLLQRYFVEGIAGAVK